MIRRYIFYFLFVFCSFVASATTWSNVEQYFIKDRDPSVYTREKIPVIETINPIELGRLSALRFIEWVHKNPHGVISLPTGKTPEYFIKFLQHYKINWERPEVQAELNSIGLSISRFPDTSNLKYVQMNEFYPISPHHRKNITNFIKKYYIDFLKIKPENQLLMELGEIGILKDKGINLVYMNQKVDLGLINRTPVSQVEMWQKQALKEAEEFCDEYEKKIKAWGGIGFLIGSIGYGGEISYNSSNTKSDSVTRLVKLNYLTCAHVAKELGGMEYARNKVAITIGLSTLMLNKNSIIITLASGHAKAAMVRDAVEKNKSILIPATIFQDMPNARFYITEGSASLLSDRRIEKINNQTMNGWGRELAMEIVIEVAKKYKKQILSLTIDDLNQHYIGKILAKNLPIDFNTLKEDTHNTIVQRIEKGVHYLELGKKNKRILHTAPQHDDVILGYYPLIKKMLNKHDNHIVYVTSGFNTVTDDYIKNTLSRACDWWINRAKDDIFNKSYSSVLNKFRRSFVRQNVEEMQMLDTTIALKHLVKIYGVQNVNELKNIIRWLKDDYFAKKLPGDIDKPKIQTFKAMMRESEADRLWAINKVPLLNISHLRSKFYTGKHFFNDPNLEKDILPLLDIYDKFEPSMITVADDPPGARPGTHYKVMQVVARSLKLHNTDSASKLKILGYRNIWFRYRVQDSNVFVPVSQRTLEKQKKAFLSCFNTQKTASFPSPFYDGDFSELTNHTQKTQFVELKLLIGENYFKRHPNSAIREARGFLFLKEMSLSEFLDRASKLKRRTEFESDKVS